MLANIAAIAIAASSFLMSHLSPQVAKISQKVRINGAFDLFRAALKICHDV
jgi:hypothetical protein